MPAPKRLALKGDEKNPSERKRVIVYSGSDPQKDPSSLFYLNLFWTVMTIGRELNYEMIPVIDTRVDTRRLLRPPEVTRILKKGKVDGVLGIMLYEEMMHWMEESALQYAVLVKSNGKDQIIFDFENMVRDAFSRLVELGCRSVGLMMPTAVTDDTLLEQVERLADEVGVVVNYEWILVSRNMEELNGYKQFRSLWDLKQRPDGLVVFPDVTARGVISAIVEQRVRIPQDLKLVLHRNSETPYMVPVPCDWMQISVEPLARAMFRVLERQWNNEEPVLEKVRFELIKGTEPSHQI